MDILEDVDHRPWPLPDQPWILRQAWNTLLFVHWPIAVDRLRSRVPAFLDIDTFDGDAWLSMTPFHLTDLTPRGLPPLPRISSFHEVNVRTYVVADGLPGVYFFSLDSSSVLAVAGASTLFHLPYHLADMVCTAGDRGISFTSQRRRGEARLEVRYAAAGNPFVPSPGTLAYWLTERYCLYTHDRAARPYRVEIHHPPWQLQTAEAEIHVNTMAGAAGLELPPTPPLLQFAQRQDVLTWRPHALR